MDHVLPALIDAVQSALRQPIPSAERLLAAPNEMMEFATRHPTPAKAMLAVYLWILLALLQPVERR